MRNRRGTIYIFVLGASTLAAAAGVTAVILHTKRLEQVRLSTQAQQARGDAQSGLELALAVLSQDPAGTTWRGSSTLSFANKRYFGADASLVSIDFADPTDNDLTDSMYDPVCVTVTAVSDPCEQQYAMTLSPVATPISALDFALTVGGTLSKTGTGDVYTSGLVSVGKAWEADSDAKPDVVGALDIIAMAPRAGTAPVMVFRPGGSKTTTTYSASSTTSSSMSASAGGSASTARSGAAFDPLTAEAVIPNTVDTVAYYQSVGTTINYSSLPSGTLAACVLSPGSNPFGSTSTEGIYLIDCRGSAITVKNCRVQGTLVLLNAGVGSVVSGNVNIEPVAANLPALVVAGDVDFDMVASDLQESVTGVNFNPASSPYDGASDADKTDVYPSWIKGAVFVSGNLRVPGAANTVRGSLIVGGNVSISNNCELRVQYAKPSVPIPGFSTVTGMGLTPGSLQRVVR